MNLNPNNNMPSPEDRVGKLSPGALKLAEQFAPKTDLAGNITIKPHKHIPLSAKLLKMSGIDPVVDDRNANSHDADNYFRDAVAVVVLCDFNGQHSAHECKIPVPLHDADVEYFKRMEPVVRQFYIGIVPKVRAVRLVSVVLEVTLNDGSRSYHAIQPR